MHVLTVLGGIMSPQKHVLTPSTSDCDLSWKQGLYRHKLK